MRATRNWRAGVSVIKLGAISKVKKRRRSKSNQKEDICLNCKENKCNKGTCNKFKK